MTQTGWIPAAVIAALVSAIVAFAGFVLTKEAKISEFRQAWIDGLRAEISDLLATFWSIHYTLSIAKTDQNATIDKATTASSELYRLRAKIRLRLNNLEIDSARINQSIDDLPGMQPGTTAGLLDYQAVKRSSQSVIDASAVVLKSEWKRVKRGEPAFVIGRWVTGSFMAALVIAVMWSIFATLLTRSAFERNKDIAASAEMRTPATNVSVPVNVTIGEYPARETKK